MEQQQQSQRTEPNEQTKKIYEQFLAKKGLNSDLICTYSKEQEKHNRDVATSHRLSKEEHCV